MRTSTTTTAAVLVALAGRAAAEPRIDLEHCTAFDRAALRKAIARALPGDTAHDRELAVVVECPDLVTAHLHVEPIPADGAIARSLDLGEVPGDLRLKLLALAVAELVEIADAAPPPRRTPPPRVAATGPRTFGDPVDPQHLADLEPRSGSPAGADNRSADNRRSGTADNRAADNRSVDNRSADNRSADHRGDAQRDHEPRRVASVEPDVTATADVAREDSALSIAPHAALRVYTSPATPLVELGGELSLPWFRIGARGAIGQTTDTLGTVRPWLATVTLARDVVCGGAATTACLVVRGEVGLAGVTAHAKVAATAIAAHDAVTGYAQLGLAAEVARRFAGWSAIASIDAGWAEGLVARAGNRDIAALAGMVVIGAVGARWP